MDIHLLKPEKLPLQASVVHRSDGDGQICDWITYEYRKKHPILQYLPTKLAEFAGECFQKQLLIPPKSGARWSVKELNAILHNNLVAARQDGTHLQCFTVLEWESDDFAGRMKARCTPLKAQWGRHTQVPKCVWIRLLIDYIEISY